MLKLLALVLAITLLAVAVEASRKTTKHDKILKFRLKQIMEMADDDYEIFSDYSMIPQDSPSIFFSKNAYEGSTIKGMLTSAVNKDEWTNVLTTNVNSRWAVTKVYTNNRDTVIVSYKGTDNYETTKTDLKSAIPTACNINGFDCGKVGKGFYQLYQADIAQVRAAVEPYIRKGYKLIITGHSLGGATSTLSAFYFATAFPNNKPTLITFAGPKVGNSDWVDAFRQRMAGARVRRFVTKWKNLGITVYDLVATVPPYFKHVDSEEILIDCLKANPISCHVIAGYIDGIEAANAL